MLMAPAGATANNQFAFDLYARLVDGNFDENICFSPFSIAAALSMLHAGARGDTAREIEAVLHVQPGKRLEPARFQDAFGQRVDSAAQPFQMANAMWAHDGYPIRAEYAALLRQRYDAEIRSVDFVQDGEPTRRIINDWVSRKTNQRIPMLLIEPLHVRTGLILTNAVYFLGKWASPFDRALTKREPFYTRPHQPVDAWMMHKTTFGYGVEGDGYRAAAIAYEDGPLMWIVLPDEGRSLAEVEAALTFDDWEARRQSAPRRPLILTLPRFKVRGRAKLAPILAELGMATAFTEAADFSGMHEPHPERLMVSAVIHEAFTDVNEERTEAAAATAVVMRAGGAKAAPPPPLELRCDRPFLFMILDAMPGAILVMGRVKNPTED